MTSLNSNVIFDIDPDLVTRCPLTRHFSTWQGELKHNPDKNSILAGLLLAYGFQIVGIALVSPDDSKNYASTLIEQEKPKLIYFSGRRLGTANSQYRSFNHT
ncbi:hypothetical protein RvY_13353 [Ramazzottius varieornatus]|uniref:Uncharacterized protein n=1 Tax=Ramazzottius varieornatus TaxID=947166 RepID=A0A1D1VMM0_RAMVA|nr:hypothetical protein RvY_13353 [Ramazzottius varieornatus]